MMVPVKTPVREENGNLVIFEPDENHIAYQTLYCCPNCRNVPLGGQVFGQTKFFDIDRLQNCPKCGEAVEWGPVDEAEAKSQKAFDDWFAKTAINGSVCMANSEGTGLLQR